MLATARSAWLWLHQSGQLAMATVLPFSCVFCGTETIADDAPLCHECLRALGGCRPLRACPRCAMPIPAAGHIAPVGHIAPDASERCVHCRKLSLAFTRTYALGNYQGALREAVIVAKQAARRVAASTLASLAAETHRESLLSCGLDVVTAVPSHWSRRLKRRGTPAQALAETFARDLHLPYRGLLRRLRRTRKQGTLTPQQRRKNVDGSFAVNRGYVFRSALDTPRGKHVLLVDDVLTTGATGNAAATALLKAGANQVTMAVIARATG